MTRKTPTAARFELGTRTIRSVPENYWLASMDSWDGAVDHDATALIFAAGPEMLVELEAPVSGNYGQPHGVTVPALDQARAIIAKAKGQS
jgi:hypothetical protein